LKKFGELKGAYVKIPNELLRDKNLSWKAKGLYSWMACNKDNFHFTINSIAAQYPDGRDAIRSAMDELKEVGWLIYTKKANGWSKYDLVTNLDEPKSDNPTMDQEPKSDNPTMDQLAYKPILDTTNIPNTENPVMATVKVTKPNTENPIMDQEPKSENPPSENPTVGKPNCINNTNSLNNTNIYKGDGKKSGEKNFKYVQDASIALSTAMDIDQIIQKHTGGKVNVH
jgi:hypothetical protein|tara:strand:- start:506 stop:1186 length:681 start_codon:yes stop_codon:yes gene_type:complete